MATAAIGGYQGKFQLAPSTGSLATVNEVRDWNVSGEMAEIDATSRDSSGHREVLVGIRSWTGSVEYLMGSSHGTQIELYKAWDNGYACDLAIYPAGTSAFPKYTGTCYITGWNPTGPHDDAIGVSLDLVGTGVLTQSTV